MYGIGIMSGTSLDGVDTVLVDIQDYGVNTNLKVIEYNEYPMPEDIRMKIKLACDEKKSRVDLICSLNFEIGYLFVEAVKKLLEKANMKASQIDFIASHGQTIYHIPFQKGKFVPSTLQIGEPSVLAYEFNTNVISNFRVMDMAAGGQGAPLVPFSEYILYSEKGKNIALQNIGGIGNVTLLNENMDIDHVEAFDTGPGNMMINEACCVLYGESYDNHGYYASQGCVIDEMLEELMNHPYMNKLPPKSTGREDFGENYVQSLIDKYSGYDMNDYIATFTYFTAKSIEYHYRRDIMSKCHLDKVIIGGGGSHNSTLIHMIKECLSEIDVYTQDEVGYSSDAKEAIAFAVLGNETLHQHFSNVKSATGAKHNVILGNITFKPVL